MVLLNTKGKGSKDNKSNIVSININRIEVNPEEIEWNMSKRIIVGKRSDGYTIMQALTPLIQMGWFLHIEQGESEPIKTTFFNPKGSPRRKGEGTTLSVALRRMTVGMSKEFSHMME